MSESSNGPDTSQTTATDASAGVENGSNNSGVDWAADLSEENRALVENKTWSSDTKINTILDSYRELESHVGKSLSLPGEDATDEDWTKFHRRTGALENAEDYKFELDSSALPEGFVYDDTSVAKYQDWAQKAEISPRQAQKLHDFFMADAVETYKGVRQSVSEQQAEETQREEAAHSALVGEWGQPDSATFKGKLGMAVRAMQELGIEEDLRSTGILSEDGGVKNANMVKALARIGSEMFSEGTVDAVNSLNGENPFDEGGNLTTQSELIKLAKKDPSQLPRVQNLIRMAGKEPSYYNL